MIFPRILAIMIIGCGYLIWNAIFKAFPFRKEYKQNAVFAWFVAFLIIIGQLIYIYYIFSNIFSYGESTPIILLVIIIPISALIFLMIWKRYRG
ncbi:MAG: hypothetical protein Q7J16_12600 [Candidatus Cloacimonadales bacterium]|nr:hypothetical protein [Candidatus Cloacimonadales bacterium]